VSTGSVAISDTPQTDSASAQVHSVSRRVALEHGEKIPDTLQSLGCHVRKSKHLYDGKH